MRDEQDREETVWLGGEAQVYPGLGQRTVPSWKRLISGGMLFAAGMGVGRLAATGSEVLGDAGRHDRVGDGERCTSAERSDPMERRREEGEFEGSGSGDGLGVVTVLAAFGLGLMAGALTTLLTTPESGTSVRGRLRRGVDAARKEFDDTVGEVKQDWSTVGDEMYDSVKRTASRVKQAAEVTKEAMTDRNGTDTSVRRAP